MPVQLRPAQVDFGALEKLPQLFYQGQDRARENQMRADLQSAINPDGTVNVQKAAAALIQTNPVAAATLLNKQQDEYISTPAGPVSKRTGLPPQGAASSAATSYPPGIDTPAKQLAYDKAFGTKSAQEQVQQSGPAAIKGREDVSSGLSDMLDSYLDLGARGGQVSPDQTKMQNLGAYAGALAPSVGGSGILGNEALARSNDIQTIKSIQPGLLLAIKQAKQQGARGLDSNVELQFYLKQATDPTYGKYVNLAAIDRLDRAYGLGGLLEKKLPPEELAKVRSTKLNLPSGVKQTSIPYDAAQEAPPQFGPEYEGKTLQGPDKKLYIIKNGQPVPVGQ